MKIATSSATSFEPHGSFQMTLCPHRLRLQPPTTQRASHAVVRGTRPELAGLDKSTRTRDICRGASLVACPWGVQVAKDAWGKSPWTTFPCVPKTVRSEEQTSELQSPYELVCRLQ